MSRATRQPEKLTLLGAAIGAGAPDEGCADGPQALLDQGLPLRLAEAGIPAHWDKTFVAPRRAAGTDPLTAVAELDAELAAETERLTRARQHFVALGGDHSAAIGLWSGVARAAHPGRFGLIWIDAHMDAHTFATTPSRMIHGMPVACLLGYGEARLTSLAGAAPAVAPENLCLIGTRSWEEGEAALLTQLGVRIIKMPEVDSRGFDSVFQEALDIVSTDTVRFGISIDIDAFDPSEITGTGLHVPNGLYQDDVVHALRRARGQRTLDGPPGSDGAALAGLEIAEYNPHHDRGGATARLISAMIAATFRV